MVEGEKASGGAQDYVCGFMFDLQLEWVVLIRKNRPPWQDGKLNGVGGKVEPGEDPLDAMIREFREETGVEEKYVWRHSCTLELSRGGRIYIYACASTKAYDVRTTTDEPIGVYSVNHLQDQVTMPNVRWLIPMLLSFTKGEKSGSFVVKEIE